MAANKNIRDLFSDGWNKLLTSTDQLRTQSLYRAQKGILNVGTPHDWEDYKKYKAEEDKDKT